MRGEKAAVDDDLQVGGGSPPHARGKVGVLVISGDVHGITPACAGKSASPEDFPHCD